VGRRQALEDVPVQTSIIELYFRSAGLANQIERLVVVDVVPGPSDVGKSAWLSERRADILHHVPAHRLLFGIAKVIDAVVAGLEVVIVQKKIDADQALERPSARKRIVEPRPFAFRLVIGLQAEPRRLTLRFP